ncbi:MAG: sigma-70 family RNA polymerase sigma factor [Planctomycetota bacterium]
MTTIQFNEPSSTKIGVHVVSNTTPARASLAQQDVRVERPATVATLVRAAQAGDRAAMGELFDRYQPTIVALAMRRVRHSHEAEELAQDVFVQAMLKINQLRVPEAFGGWLRQIVHRMALNRLCRNKSAIACDPETLAATCMDESLPETAAEDREQADAVRHGIDQLGPLDQQTLDAFYLRGQTLVQMSQQFDAPIGTIKRRLHTARKRLAKTMRDTSTANDWSAEQVAV